MVSVHLSRMQYKHKVHLDVHVNICGNRGKPLEERGLGHEGFAHQSEEGRLNVWASDEKITSCVWRRHRGCVTNCQNMAV